VFRALCGDFPDDVRALLPAGDTLLAVLSKALVLTLLRVVRRGTLELLRRPAHVRLRRRREPRARVSVCDQRLYGAVLRGSIGPVEMPYANGLVLSAPISSRSRRLAAITCRRSIVCAAPAPLTVLPRTGRLPGSHAKHGLSSAGGSPATTTSATISSVDAPTMMYSCAILEPPTLQLPMRRSRSSTASVASCAWDLTTTCSRSAPAGRLRDPAAATTAVGDDDDESRGAVGAAPSACEPPVSRSHHAAAPGLRELRQFDQARVNRDDRGGGCILDTLLPSLRPWPQPQAHVLLRRITIDPRRVHVEKYRRSLQTRDLPRGCCSLRSSDLALGRAP